MSMNKNFQESPDSSSEKRSPDKSSDSSFQGLDMEIMSPNPRIEQPLLRKLKTFIAS